jgi:tripartite-type tricarboxylate transporter receptor subunit TctC
VNFDTLTDFTPIALAFGMSCTVVVKADSPIRTLADLVAQLRRDPKTPYASGGFGTAAHLTAALFLAGTRTEAEHIPFRGAPDIINAVRSGTVAFGFPQTQVALPLIQAGQLRAIGVTTTAPLAALPGVPTVAETVPGYEFLSWMGLLGPAGLPAPILGKIEKAAMETLADPAFRARISADGTSLIGLGAADFRTFLANDMARGREMVRVSGARIE